tara:strand:- start:690 stop:1394 length:705 start_codon:yes stop_codon:yes gene_type:complete
MSDETKFETYISINNDKFVICVIEKSSSNILFKEEEIYDDDKELSDLDKLDNFLEKNIFKIEKVLKDFIQDVFIILKSKKFFPIGVSIKRENHNDFIYQKNLIHPLNDLKNLCQFNYKDKKIIHMIIEKYCINNKDYTILPKNLKCDNFTLDIKFDCLPNKLVQDYEYILKKYHIFLNQVLNANYIKQFKDKSHQSIFITASLIVSGRNNNEVLLVNKIARNKGFFEKFFDFFS